MSYSEALVTVIRLQVNKHDGVFTTVVCPYYINTGMFDGVKSKWVE